MLCFKPYGSIGPRFIIIYILDKLSLTLATIYQQPFTTAILVFLALCVGGSINRESDLGQTITNAFNIIREDISTAINKRWLSLNNVFIHFYRTLTFIKIIEILFVGLLLKCLPELTNFLFESLDKIAKI